MWKKGLEASRRRSQALDSPGEGNTRDVRFRRRPGLGARVEGVNGQSSRAGDDVEGQRTPFSSNTRLRFREVRELDHVEIRLVKATPINRRNDGGPEQRGALLWAGVAVAAEGSGRGREDGEGAQGGGAGGLAAGGGRNAGAEWIRWSEGRSAARVAFSRNIGCRKNRGIARDLLYAEPELGAGHSQPSLPPALLHVLSSCIRPRTTPASQSARARPPLSLRRPGAGRGALRDAPGMRQGSSCFI